jgi:hypothetical protein
VEKNATKAHRHAGTPRSTGAKLTNRSLVLIRIRKSRNTNERAIDKCTEQQDEKSNRLREYNTFKVMNTIVRQHELEGNKGTRGQMCTSATTHEQHMSEQQACRLFRMHSEPATNQMFAT